MVWFIWSFNLLNPNIKISQLLIDQVLVTVWNAQVLIDDVVEEREESQTKELQQKCEDMLIHGCTWVVTVAYSSDDFNDPVECVNVDCLCGVDFILLSVYPRFYAMFAWLNYSTWFHAAKFDPNTSHNVDKIHSTREYLKEISQINLPFSRLVSEHKFKYVV